MSTMPSSSAPRTRRAISQAVSTKPITNTTIGSPLERPEPDRQRPVGGLHDEPGGEEADERDEQADADADGALEAERHRLQHRLAGSA